MSDPICVHCRSSLFSPTASICAFCEQYPHSKETEVGLLKRIWIYDKVDLPKVCTTCGSDENLEAVTFSAPVDPENPSIFRLAYLFMTWRWGKLIGESALNTADLIEFSAVQCESCKKDLKLPVIQIDPANKRTEILGGEDFIRELELKK